MNNYETAIFHIGLVKCKRIREAKTIQSMASSFYL